MSAARSLRKCGLGRCGETVRRQACGFLMMRAIKRKLSSMSEVARSPAIRNAGWMVSEKALSLFGLIFVTSYVARYIGPGLFGELALATAIFQVIQIASQLGSDSILFKRIARNRTSGRRLMKATFFLRLKAYWLFASPVLAWFCIGKELTSVAFFMAAATACFFSSIDLVAIFNNAILRSRENALINLIGIAVAITMRVVIVRADMWAGWLALPIIMTSAVPYLIRTRLHRQSFGDVAIAPRGRRYVRYMLRAGSMLVLSSVSIALYVRIGQYMVAGLLGQKMLGIYASASTLATAWSFALTALITSFYPAIYSAKTEVEAMGKAARLGRVVVAVSTPIVIAYALAGEWAIDYLYGPEYSAAYLPGLILAISVVASSLGTVSYRYIVRLSGYRFLSAKMLFVLAISIPVSWFLIKWKGLVGAASAVLIVELISLTVMNYIYRKGVIARLHFNTLWQAFRS